MSLKSRVAVKPAPSPMKAALRGCRTSFFSAGIFSFFINILMLTGPLFMLQIYDRVLTSRSTPTLVALLVLVAALFLFLGLFDFVRGRILVRIGARLESRLQRPVFNAVLNHKIRGTANIGTRPIRDLEAIRMFTASGAPATVFDLPWTLIYLAVNFALHWALGAFSVVAAIILLVLATLSELNTRGIVTQSSAATAASLSVAEEGRRNAEAMRALGMLDAFTNRWLVHQAEAGHKNLRASDVSTVYSSTGKALRMLFQSMILALGAWLVIDDKITPGTMIAASIILSRALAPVEQSLTHWRSFQHARKAYSRLEIVLGEIESTANSVRLPPPIGEVSVSSLAIAPPGHFKPVAQGLNFGLSPGEVLGVIGPTGAGKSSLTRVLVGVWPPRSGHVRLDGATLDQRSSDDLGRHLGYLPQEVELFAGTVAENIARFSEGSASGAIVHAAKLVDVHDMILRLPEGYDTQIGESGSVLSAGQRQRIGLARAVFGEPVLVVLDEPDANLDAEGAEALLRTLVHLKRLGITVVVTAHRTGTLKPVDKVLALAHGRQVAFGEKNEVLRICLGGGIAQDRPEG